MRPLVGSIQIERELWLRWKQLLPSLENSVSLCVHVEDGSPSGSAATDGECIEASLKVLPTGVKTANDGESIDSEKLPGSEKELAKKLMLSFEPEVFRVPEIAFPEPGPNENLPPIFIHIHLPKTGGSSFNAYLSRVFKEGMDVLEGRLCTYARRLDAYEVLHYIEGYKNESKAAASHNMPAILPYQNSVRRIVAMSIVRHPVDTFISKYFFRRRTVGGSNCARMLLPDFIGIFEARSIHYSPFFYHFISKRTYHDEEFDFRQVMGGKDSADEAFEYVKRLVRNGHMFLFNMESLDELPAFLARRFPLQFQDGVQMPKENVGSEKDQKITEDDRSRIGAIVSPYDWELYEMSKAFWKEVQP